jgi:hypothetical protein
MRSYRSGYNQTARMNEGETSSRIGITQYVQCTVQYGVYAVYDIKGMCRITVGTQQESASVCSSRQSYGDSKTLLVFTPNSRGH